MTAEAPLPGRRPLVEPGLCFLALLLLWNGLYLYAAFGSQTDSFGFNQLRRLGPAGTATGLAILVLLLALAGPIGRGLGRLEQTIRSQSAGRQAFLFALAALGFCALFLSLRSEFINFDGKHLPAKFLHDVPRLGAHVTHDEMLELYVHSLFWDATYRAFGWSVQYSYQVWSSFVGGLFVFFLLRFAFDQLSRHALLFFLLMLCGGYMQLYFGDFENYTQVSLFLFLYLAASIRYLQGRTSLLVPSALLSVAMCFHLLAGWILPSLASLFWVAFRRREIRPILLAGALFVAILLAVLTFFHFNDLPIRLLLNSHAFGHMGLGRGGNVLKKLATPSWEYYRQITNLLFLLCPAVALAPVLLGLRQIRWNPVQVFLLIASLSMLVFMYAWFAAIGVYEDWNLFASCALPLSLFVWLNFVQLEEIRFRDTIRVLALLTFGWHSYAWIVSNHFAA